MIGQQPFWHITACSCSLDALSVGLERGQPVRLAAHLSLAHRDLQHAYQDLERQTRQGYRPARRLWFCLP